MPCYSTVMPRGLFAALALAVSSLTLSGPVQTEPPPGCPGDQTAELQALIDATPEGGALDLTGQTFTVESTVYLPRAIELIAGTTQSFTDGSCAPVAPHSKAANWPLDRAHFWITGSDVTIRQTVVEGPNVEARYRRELELQHGFVVTGDAQRVTLEAVTARNVWGDGLSTGTTGTHGHIAVTNATVDGAGRMGVGISAGHDLTFDGLLVRRTARSGFDVEPICVDGPNGPKTICHEVRRLTLRGSTFQQITNHPVAVVGYTINVSDITVVGNRFESGLSPFVQAHGGTSYALPPGRSTGLTISGNTATFQPTGPAVIVSRWDAVTVADNNMPVRLPMKATRVVWGRFTATGGFIGPNNNQGVGVIELRS